MQKHAIVTVHNYACFVYSYYPVQIRVLIACINFCSTGNYLHILYRPHRVACRELGWSRLMPLKWMTALTMPVADHTKLRTYR